MDLLCTYMILHCTSILKIPACNYSSLRKINLRNYIVDPSLIPTHTTTPVPTFTRITPQ